jgi:hypothetical protein
MFSCLALTAVAVPLACGGLDSGQIVIVEENAGSPGTGGTFSGSSGKGGTAGGSASGGRGGANGGTGATSGDAGEAGTGPAGGAGSSNGGSSNGGSSNGGSSNGGSSNGGSSNGGTGNVPSECTDGTDCDATLPICDSGSCRACTTSTECADRDSSLAFCYKTDGACVQCLKSSDCGASLPVCDDHACRKCEEGSECASGACYGGRCADESQVVYALAGTGSYDSDCGTKDKPCISLSEAATKLTSSRSFLVMIPTQLEFNDNVTLPAMLDLTVFGNHVKVNAYNTNPPQPGFIVSGGTVTLDDVAIEQNGNGSGAPTTGLLCNAGSLKARRLSVKNLDTTYSSVALRLTGCNAEIRESEFAESVIGLTSDSTAPGSGTQSLVVERSLFRANREALHFDGDHFLIRNNLFVGNGQDSYVRIVRPIAHSTTTPSYFVFNTLYGNDNHCSYEGGLIACEGGEAACGILSSNITWHNMYGGSGLAPCPDQVYVGAPTFTYSIAETTWVGTQNSSSDPLFTDPDMGDFTLQAASPAIDQANPDPNLVPSVDYYGNPRPAGDGPDIGAVEAPAP